MSLPRKLITQFIQNKSSFVKLYTITDKNTNDYPLFGTMAVTLRSLQYLLSFFSFFYDY
jgi:hypothetical protein